LFACFSRVISILVVEDLMKKREPLGMLEAVYFIQPNKAV